MIKILLTLFAMLQIAYASDSIQSFKIIKGPLCTSKTYSYLDGKVEISLEEYVDTISNMKSAITVIHKNMKIGNGEIIKFVKNINIPDDISVHSTLLEDIILFYSAKSLNAFKEITNSSIGSHCIIQVKTPELQDVILVLSKNENGQYRLLTDPELEIIKSVYPDAIIAKISN